MPPQGVTGALEVEQILATTRLPGGYINVLWCVLDTGITIEDECGELPK
jgi:hypothetical protein